MTIEFDVTAFEPIEQKWRKCYVCGYYFPESRMVKYQGHWFNGECWRWRYAKKKADEYKPDVTDDLD